MKMRLAGIVRESISDGPGIRIVVFFQGCPHACSGCHNPQTWDRVGGSEIDTSELIADLRFTPLISGVTFSGGEPFAQAEAAVCLADEVKARGLNLWVYSGYTWETLISENKPGWHELLNRIDILVDGPFQKQNRDLTLPFRGSTNQRIIRVPESLLAGEMCT